MAYDQVLGARVGDNLTARGIAFVEKKMFGGLGFMLNDKMCLGIIKDDLMARVLDEDFERVITLPGAREMDFTGRPMHGFVLVSGDSLADDRALDQWIARGLEFAERGIVKSKRK